MAGPRAGRGAQPLVQQHTFQENENRANWAFDNLTYISAVEMYVKSAEETRTTPPLASLQLAGLEKRSYLVQALAHARGQGADFGRGLVQVGNHNGHETACRAGPYAGKAILKHKRTRRIAAQTARGLKEDVGRRLEVLHELTGHDMVEIPLDQ